MDAREAILAAVRRSRPAPSPLPEPVPATPPAEGLEERFTRLVHEIGGRVVRVPPGGAEEALRAAYPGAGRIASAVPAQVPGNFDLRSVSHPRELADVDLFVAEGVLGVAENGAVWLPESRVVQRVAPFIAQHLAVVLDRRHLVADMREAYERLRVDEEGYGVFVAGPSKTADIEQSLVIGAHGARSLTVLLR